MVRTWFYFLTRLLTTGVWIPAAIYKAMNYQWAMDEMTHHGLPMPGVLLPIVLLLEVGGSILLIINRYVSFVALAWMAFLIPATILYHGNWYSPDGDFILPQYFLFIKNISIFGGLMALVALDDRKPEVLRRFVNT